MLRKKLMFNLLVVVLFSLFYVNCLFAGIPNLKLPYPGGEKWRTSCAYDGTGGEDCTTHASTTKDRYALDFNWGSGNDDCDKPTVAVAYGTVIMSKYRTDGYGNCVKIDHGDGYVSLYAHLESRSVQVGDIVVQGQEIGKVGNSGTVSCHLHFAFYKVVDGVETACKPEPMSNCENSENFTANTSYTSDNYDGTVTDLSVCSSTVYLASNGKLWPILNEKVYSLLGYRSSTCTMTPNWSHVVPSPDSEKSNYATRKEVIPSENNAATGYMIAYRVVPKVGPVSCMCIAVDTTRIYLFEDGKFCHIANEQVYKALGYKPDFSDVVNITPELFHYYGEGPEIDHFSFEYSSIFLSSSDGGSGGPTLTHIEITGPSSLPENSGAQYKCVAHYDDDSSIDVTNSAGWGEGCGNASIDPHGYLTTHSVPSDEAGEGSAPYLTYFNFLSNVIGLEALSKLTD